MKAQADLAAMTESLLRLVMLDPDSYGVPVVEELVDTHKRAQRRLAGDAALGIRDEDKVRIL